MKITEIIEYDPNDPTYDPTKYRKKRFRRTRAEINQDISQLKQLGLIDQNGWVRRRRWKDSHLGPADPPIGINPKYR